MLSINPGAPHGPLGWFAHQPSAIRIRQGRPGYRPSCQRGGGHLRWHLAGHLGATYSLAIHLFISCPWASRCPKVKCDCLCKKAKVLIGDIFLLVPKTNKYRWPSVCLQQRLSGGVSPKYVAAQREGDHSDNSELLASNYLQARESYQAILTTIVVF